LEAGFAIGGTAGGQQSRLIEPCFFAISRRLKAFTCLSAAVAGKFSGSRWLLHSEAAFGIGLPLPASDRRQSRMRV
jgi:hypothetical protein